MRCDLVFLPTFTGLCKDHDQNIFKAIDNDTIDLNNSEHLFLFAYRAIYKELYAKMDAALKIQLAYLKHVDIGIDSGKEETNASNIATSKIWSAHNMYFYKVKYDKIFLIKALN